jgi:DNA-binding response OmpR family regulator
MTKQRVLIVDDEPDIVETVQYCLEYENIDCLVAGDGQEALKLARRENPDVVILDVMLPKLNGYKVARLLKFDKSYCNIPIIMLTARAQANDIRTGEETGADEYLTKPFDMQQLTSLVKKHLTPHTTPKAR